MFSRTLVTVTLVLYAINSSSGFAISPESIALKTASIGSHISDIRHTVADATHKAGETIQEHVNTAVDTVNQASAAATAHLNKAFEHGHHAVKEVVSPLQHAVHGAVHSTQKAFNGAVHTTQKVVGDTVETASHAMRKAVNTVLHPFRLAGQHVSDRFVLISNTLYKIVHPNLEQEVVYVPVSPSTYVHPGVVVPTNHHVQYTDALHPNYAYKSDVLEEYLPSGSENVENIVVPETPKNDQEGKIDENGFEYLEIQLPTETISNLIDGNRGLIQPTKPSEKSLDINFSHDEQEFDNSKIIRTKRVVPGVVKRVPETE